MKAYEEFLRDAGGPLAWLIIVGVVLFGTFLFAKWAFSANPQHQEFAEACTLLDATVEKMAGNHFCVKVTVNDTILTPDMNRYQTECREAGGLPKSRNYIDACYMYEIIQELGERDDYVPND